MLKSLLTNKHTNGGATLLLLCVLIAKILKVWFPEHSAQIDSNIADIKDFAMLWIGYGAADSSLVGGIKKDVQEIKTGTNIFPQTQQTQNQNQTNDKT